MIPDLADYKLENFIIKANKFSFWSAYHKQTNERVLVKLITYSHDTVVYKSQLKHEYEILKSLSSIDTVPSIISFEYNQDVAAIIFKDNNMLPLSSYLKNKQLTLNSTLEIILNIVTALGHIHQQHILHKNINLDSILIDPLSKHINLLGFEISSKLGTEYQVFVNPNILEGSLEYISPEQTGRMNAFIDYRSDFYSLGIVFYHLLTGQVPFQSTDAIEIVHSHIAKKATSPSLVNLKIPTAISNIVMKLLEKNATERYQSSYGLKTDIQECLKQIKDKNFVDEFTLGQKDIAEELQIPRKLYGREKEIKLLIDSFSNITNNSELVLVSGYSGIGKSSVVQEIYKPITQKKGYFIGGKYDQFQRNIPYSAIIKAFSSLIKQILTESVEKISFWKSKLLNILNPNAQIIIDVIPELELIIGAQSPVTKLPLTQAQNRFNLVFQNFVQVLAQPNNPLVLFLDDLQWADVSSINLLEQLITDYEIRNLLIIGAYRDNEVDETHPLMVMLDRVKSNTSRINKIVLTPLNLSNIEQLITDTFKTGKVETQQLATICYQKTGGNPFFLEQFIKRLYEINLIKFNRDIGKWSWNIEAIKQADITNNVLDLMLAKIKSLSNESQNILKLAACIGNQFDLKTLSIINEKDVTSTFSSLWDILQEGLILPINDNYKFVGSISTGQIIYRFLHDRVQQAVYSLIQEVERDPIHLKIGRLILANTSEQDLEEKIFDVVNQMNYGVSLITETEEKLKLIELNLSAGKKAKESIAYDSAFRYCKIAINLLPKNAWQNYYQLTFFLYLEVSEAAYLNSDFEEMKVFIQVAIDNANNLLDKVNAYEIKIQSLVAELKPLEAINVSLLVLKLLGIELPTQPSKADVLVGLLKTKWLLKGKTKENITSLPKMTDPYKLAVMRILYAINSAAFFACPNLFILSVFTRLKLSIEYGNTNESAHAYAAYGLILCGVLKEIELGNQYGEIALNILEQFNAKEEKSDTFFAVYGFIKTWKTHFQEMLDPLFDSYQNGLETGNIEYSIYSIQCYLAFLIISGRELSFIKSETNKYIKVTDKLRHKMGNYLVRMYDQIVLNLVEQEPNNSCINLIGQSYNENIVLPMYLSANDRTSIGILYFNKLFLSYLFQDYKQAINNLNVLKQYLDGLIGTYISAYFYFYDSLVWLAVYETVSLFEKVEIYSKVVFNQRKIKKWMQHAPMNFSNKYYLVEAEKARVLQDRELAANYYDKSIELAKQYNYIQEEALANELAGRFYLAKNKKRISKLYLLDAQRCYIKWEAFAKVAQLEKQYSEFLLESNKVKILDDNSQNLLLENKTTSLDLDTVIKASQAISSEIVLDKLMTELLSIVVKNAGATRGFLLLKRGNQFFVEVEAYSDKGATKLSEAMLLESVKYISPSIVNYVIRTKEDLVIDNVAKDDRFIQDSYVITTNPKSILSIPIINQGNLTGILYLENNLTIGAFTVERLQILHMLSAQAAISIENANLYTDLTKALEHEKVTKRVQAELLAVQKELAYARQLQLSMLPKRNLFLDKVEIVGQMRTATEVGGDYYDFIQISPNSYCLAIGDATGHGVGAGLVVGMIKSLLVSSILNIKPVISKNADNTNKMVTVEIMNNLNFSLKSSLAYRNMGMALTLAIVDLDNMLMEVCSAAMPPIVFYHESTKNTEIINLPGLPLGFVRKINLKAVTLELKPGDKLVFVSDGFPERMNNKEELWGYETVNETLREICQNSQNSESLLQKLFLECDKFAQEVETNDDMTALALHLL